MVSSFHSKKLILRASKIVHKSSHLHQLARFVTEEAVCLMYKIKLEDIYSVECWRYVVYVHAKGLSKFISYADFPPIVGVAPPTPLDCIKWRKRWRKSHDFDHRKQAPTWWAEFYTSELLRATSEAVLSSWGELVNLIKFAFSEETLQQLRSSYHQETAIIR
ncbi:MAG TPA: hypothetical protein VK203_22295 [Nostocaceae cyanobacterium]|nr:hypothetical protein [Nostocaceae cyanobacterium]